MEALRHHADLQAQSTKVFAGTTTTNTDNDPAAPVASTTGDHRRIFANHGAPTGTGLLTYEDRAEAQDRIDAAARAAGRDPQAIRRLAQLPGIITDDRDNGPPVGHDPIVGPPQRWVETIDHFVRDFRYDTVIFWPDETNESQLHRFIEEVVPRVRATLTAEQN